MSCSCARSRCRGEGEDGAAAVVAARAVAAGGEGRDPGKRRCRARRKHGSQTPGENQTATSNRHGPTHSGWLSERGKEEKQWTQSAGLPQARGLLLEQTKAPLQRKMALAMLLYGRLHAVAVAHWAIDLDKTLPHSKEVHHLASKQEFSRDRFWRSLGAA